MDKMFSSMDDNILHGMSFLFKKIWKQIYSQITIESNSINIIKNISINTPIIFIPTHRSYVDFLIISYICFVCGLPIPHIAAGEDFLGILLVRYLFRRSGAFFIRRQLQNDTLYTTILHTYMCQLLKDRQSIEFFIEGTRSRSGKMLQPKQGMLSMLTDAYLDGNIPDAYIVPIAINYEKVMEGGLYSNELLGENKIRESLRSLLRSSHVLTGNFGAIHVSMGQPISLAEYTKTQMSQITQLPTQTPRPVPSFSGDADQIKSASTTIPQAPAPRKQRIAIVPLQSDGVTLSAPLTSTALTSTSTNTSSSSSSTYDPIHQPSHRRYFNYIFSYEIVYRMTVLSCVMPTHIVATLLLMYRQGITFVQLVSQVDWVGRELHSRGARTFGLDGEDRTQLVHHAIQQLGHLIIQRRQNVFEPQISARVDYRNMLILGFYRNKLTHHFFREGLWACALYSFGHAVDEGTWWCCC